jgi:hypothetical protein
MIDDCMPPPDTKPHTWHWVQHHNIDRPRPALWIGWTWWSDKGDLPPSEALGEGYRYVAPIFLPEEVAMMMLKARAAGIESQKIPHGI